MGMHQLRQSVPLMDESAVGWTGGLADGFALVTK